MSNEIVLSVCIPTYNRCARVVALVSAFLQTPGPFELCVHDDGSSDSTKDALADLAKQDGRLKVSHATNMGRAYALRRAVEHASGKYLMFFDDDDTIISKEFQSILEDCKTGTPAGVAGYIYQMDVNGHKAEPFPVVRSNLIALRADHKVVGDKKEVIQADLLKLAMQQTPPGRRVPTSLYWARIALDHDIICKNIVVGNKIYIEGGLTNSIKLVKAQNIDPMIAVHATRIKAYSKGRYRSLSYLIRSFLGWTQYSLRKMTSARQ